MDVQLTALSIGLSVLLLSLVLFFVAYIVFNRLVQQRRNQQLVNRLFEPGLNEAGEPQGETAGAPTGALPRMASQMEVLGRTLDETRLKASEEARMLRQAGYRKPQAVFVFMGLRLFLVALAVIGGIIGSTLFAKHVTDGWAFVVGAAILAYLLPKFVLQSKAHTRVRRFNGELPFFVDMLAMLQGVGLSLEQSLFSLGQAQDIGLPIISHELDAINRQIAAGRSRLEAMQRIADMMADADFAELVAMLRQIDRYGGDVASTLRSFSERLQEKQRMQLRERIGKLTVKMTGVMILTMVPALLMITAGPGFLAIIRFLNRMAG